MGIDITSISSVMKGIFFSFWFLIAIIIGLYFPGRLLFRTFSGGMSLFQRSVAYVGIGMALWIFQGYIFGLAHMRWATYIYISIILILSLSSFRIASPLRLKAIFKFIKNHLWIILLFLLGVLVQTIQAIPSGFIFADGWHTFIADDATWHLGLTGELIAHMPPSQPGTIGIQMTNYHYFANLFIADFVRVFGFPFLTAQFFYIYVFLSVMLGLLLFSLGRMVGLSLTTSTLLMYFQYFASDIIYLVPLFTRHVMDFTAHPLEDGTMFLENPPRAFSYVFILLGIILLLQTVRLKHKLLGILTGCIFGLIIGTKIHSGIMVLFGLAGLGAYGVVNRKWYLLSVSITALVISCIIYIPTNFGAGGPVFSPFEMARMFAAQPKFEISFLELRRQIYLAHNNVIRVFQMNIIMFVIFYVAIFGIRIVGWFGWWRAKKVFGVEVAVFLFTALIGTTLFATLYIQPITYADIFNSYLAASVILSILSALTVEWIIRKKNKLTIIVVCIILGISTIPRISYRMIEFVKRTHQGGLVMKKSEIDTMDFVRKNTKKDVVVHVFNAAQLDGYASYVSAMISRDTFLAGQNYLGRHSVNYRERQHLADIIATSSNPTEVSSVLNANNIKILYAYKPFILPEGLSKIGVRKIFENDSNILYQYE